MNIKEIRRNNAQAIIDKIFSGKAIALARAMGMDNANSIYRSMSDNPSSRGIGNTLARNIEKAAKKPNGWLDQIHHESNVSEPSVKYQASADVPLISRVSAGKWSEASDPFQPGDAEGWYPCPANHSASTYALRVWGDSMTAPYGRSYPEGMIIYVDPEKEAVSGDRVIARVNGDYDVNFKQLIIEGSRRYLKALNPNWPIITDEFEVIGKVIGAYMEE